MILFNLDFIENKVGKMKKNNSNMALLRFRSIGMNINIFANLPSLLIF